jgi:hypothetical protein
MFSAATAGLPAIAAATLILAALHTTPALGSDKVDARFEIFGFAGLHVLTNVTSTVETPTGYAIAMDLDTRGLASVFVDLKSHSEVQGARAGDALRPAAYQSEVRRNGSDHYYGVKYLSDGSVIDNSSPRSAANVHVETGQGHGTVDQLTAYLLLEQQLAQRGSCRLTVPVFDGSELYRLHFSDIRDETLSPDRFQAFSGSTRLCQVVREVLVASPSKDESTYQQGRIWYASLLPGLRMMIPVRMEYDTDFGIVSGYLAELTGEGVHLHLMGN